MRGDEFMMVCINRALQRTIQLSNTYRSIKRLSQFDVCVNPTPVCTMYTMYTVSPEWLSIEERLIIGDNQILCNCFEAVLPTKTLSIDV